MSHWNRSSVAVFTTHATEPADEWLRQMTALVVATQTGADAHWEVATASDVSPRYLLLRRKNGNAGRIIFFGQQGSSPNTPLAARGGTIANKLWVGYSAASNVNVPDNSWITTKPLAATDWMEAVVCWPMTVSLPVRLQYVESTNGIYFTPVSTDTTGTLNYGYAIAGAGELVENTGGTNRSCILGSANTTTSWKRTFAENVNGTPAVDASYDPSFNFGPALVVRVGTSNLLYFRAFTQADRHFDETASIVHLSPIWLVGPTDVAGTETCKFRRVAHGPNRVREGVYVDLATGVRGAYAQGYTPTAAVAGATNMWFTEGVV